MEYLKISNHTEIDKNAFKLIGACTKRDDDSKIGYFGSGLKYALAVLLRENINLKIFSGIEEIEIGLISEIFREQAFNVISICGEKTSLTTSMGTDWEVWQAVREIYCNALDEEEPSHSLVEKIIPETGTTSFFIPVDDKGVKNVLDNWDKYFAHNREVIAGDCCKIYASINDAANVYRKGIRCWDEEIKSLYDYDFNTLDITESRIAKYSFQIRERVAKLWGKYATTQMINNFVKSGKDIDYQKYLEGRADWNYAKFSNVWRDYFKGKILVPRLFAGWFPDITAKPNSIILDDGLLRNLKKQFGESIQTAAEEMDFSGKFCIIKPDKRQTFLLKECLAFFDEVGLSIPYDIKIAAFESKKTMGRAKNSNIILSTNVFDRGKKHIAATILEEYAHLESEQADETRGFQNYLINQIITLLENQHGIFL